MNNSTVKLLGFKKNRKTLARVCEDFKKVFLEVKLDALEERKEALVRATQLDDKAAKLIKASRQEDVRALNLLEEANKADKMMESIDAAFGVE